MRDGARDAHARLRHGVPRRRRERDVPARSRADVPGERRRARDRGRAPRPRAGVAALVLHVVGRHDRRGRGTVGREDSPHRGSFLSHYERSKFLGERRVLELGDELGLRRRLREPLLGARARAAPTARRGCSSDLVNGRLPVLVDTWLSIVDIDDCTAGPSRWPSRDGVPGRRYLLSGRPRRRPVRRRAAARRRAVGPRASLRSPRAVASAAGAAAAGAAALMRRDLPFCPELVRTLLHGHRYDGSRAERELGLRYTPLEETVRRTLTWYARAGADPTLHGPRSAA